MKKLILILTLIFTSYAFANNEVKIEEDLLTCTYTITRITSEEIIETTYQIETRTAEECQQAMESHLQYVRTMDALQ